MFRHVHTASPREPFNSEHLSNTRPTTTQSPQPKTMLPDYPADLNEHSKDVWPRDRRLLFFKREKKSLIPWSMHHFSLSLFVTKWASRDLGGCILALSTLNCQHSTWLCGGFADGSFLNSLMGHMRNILGVSGRRAAIKGAGGLTEGRYRRDAA